MAAVLGWRSRSVDSPDLGAVGEGGFVVVATQGHYDEPALMAAWRPRQRSSAWWHRRSGPHRCSRRCGRRGWTRSSWPGSGPPPVSTWATPATRRWRWRCWPSWLRLRAAAGAAAPAVVLPEVAIDPVCGMEVDPATARFSAEHDGAHLLVLRRRVPAAVRGGPPRLPLSSTRQPRVDSYRTGSPQPWVESSDHIGLRTADAEANRSTDRGRGRVAVPIRAPGRPGTRRPPATAGSRDRRTRCRRADPWVRSAAPMTALWSGVIS